MSEGVIGGGQFDIHDLKPYAEMARELQPGTMRWIPRSYMNVAELIGLRSASFLLKLPEVPNKKARLHMGDYWYTRGRPALPVEWIPGPWAQYEPYVSCWLIDLAIMGNWFAERPSWEAICFARCIPLDLDGGVILASHRLKWPEQLSPRQDAFFHLVVNPEAEVRIKTDIHLGCWSEQSSGSPVCNDFSETIEKSHLACVFVARFQ